MYLEMYKTILAPLDGSDTAAQVLPYVKLIAGAGDVPVKLLEAVPSLADLARAVAFEAEMQYENAVVPESHYTDHLRGVQEGFKRAARTHLKGVEADFREAGIEVQSQVLEGSPAEAIMAAAEREPESLVAMTTRGRSGIGRWISGSVADKVVRHSRRPTLVVRAKAPEEVSRDVGLAEIVLPLDGSTLSEQALPHAAALAMALRLPVTIVHAVTLTPLGYGIFEDGPAQRTDLFQSVRHTAQKYAADAAERVRAKGVRHVGTRIIDAPPEETILEEAGEAGDKLVVMATHGRSGLGRWTLGSVADRVLHHYQGPIVLIRSTEGSAA